MRFQIKVVSAGLLLILTFLALGILYKYQASSKEVACLALAESLKSTIDYARGTFLGSGGIAITELEFPSSLSYEIYNKSGETFILIKDCNLEYFLGSNISIPEKKIIGREKVWLYVSSMHIVLTGNYSKLDYYLQKDESFLGCIFCSGKCCKIGGGYKCYSGNECCQDSDCNLTNCVAAGGTPKCDDGYCTCQCPSGYYWNGTTCVNRPGSIYCDPSVPLPSKWDWRNVAGKNYVTSIKDQGHCGSCWAFASIGAVEADYKVENNLPTVNIDLSEQNLVSPGCGAGGSCDGGNPGSALGYIKTVGVVNETCFSYTSGGCKRRGRCLCPCPIGCANPCSCNLCPNPKRWRISSFYLVIPTVDAVKRALICYGPLVVASTNWSHAVVLVGYDDHSNICHNKYGTWGCWIVKNSWGIYSGWWTCPSTECKLGTKVWHENGYAYIPYTGHNYSDLKDFALAIENVIPPK